MENAARDPSLDDRFDPAVRIVDHARTWIDRAAAECERIRVAVGGSATRVDHVGSTAVPGLAAKPILDIQLSVADVAAFELFGPALARLGYTFIRDPESRDFLLFVRPAARPRTHHVHVCTAGSAHEYRHLAVRDYLRTSPAEVRAQAAVKRELVARCPQDRLAYIAGKDAYVRALEDRALAWRRAQGAPARS